MGWFLAGWLHVTGFPIIDIQLQFDLVAPFVGYGAVNGADGGWQGVGSHGQRRRPATEITSPTFFCLILLFLNDHEALAKLAAAVVSGSAEFMHLVTIHTISHDALHDRG